MSKRGIDVDCVPKSCKELMIWMLQHNPNNRPSIDDIRGSEWFLNTILMSKEEKKKDFEERKEQIRQKKL